MTDMERWEQDRINLGWEMPSAPAWKRLPAIRHIRVWYGRFQVNRWYKSGPGILGIPSGYDNWVLFGIWHGKEQSHD